MIFKKQRIIITIPMREVNLLPRDGAVIMRIREKALTHVSSQHDLKDKQQ